MQPHPIRRKQTTPVTGFPGRLSDVALPVDIVQACSKRLGIAGLLYAAVTFLAYIAYSVAYGLADPEAFTFFGERTIFFFTTIVGIVLGIGVYLLTRSPNFPKNHVGTVGLTFEVLGALIISISELWRAAHTGFEGYSGGISWVCTWLLVFPILVPSPPKKTLIAAMLAASTGPLVILFAVAKGAPFPPPETRIILFAPNWISAALAYVTARIVYRLGADVAQARDLGSYHLVSRLGSGGMGEVWRAQHRMLARPAAIKLIRPESLGAQDYEGARVLRSRFEREAQATATLQSPHTVELFDFGVTEDGTFYYVMELLDGLDLESLVQRFGPLPAGRVVYLLRQACHSLAEAHHHHLVHRDIKPANLYACRLGLDYDVLKVLDFGLVKHRRPPAEGATRITMAHTTTGTPGFMPPELALGKPDVDGRADIYSLGCVAYWLLTGQLVFEGESAMEVIVQHVQSAPVPPSQRTELEVPADLERIILQCLEKNPADRPASAEALSALLAACHAGDGWSGDRARTWWERHRPPVMSMPTEPTPVVEST